MCVCVAGALNNLGCLYEHGSELTARDLAAAVQYYTAGAQLGCAAAQARESTLEYPRVP
jgi:TPR repeat protein